MTNSTASIFIKPTIAFNHGDTFVFGSWVCTAKGDGSFQRRLTMSPNPKTEIVTLPEVITGTLTGKFGEISLYNQHTDFEFESTSNLNSTSPWPSHASRLLSHRVKTPRSTSTSHMASAMLAEPTRKLLPHAGLAGRLSLTTLRTPTPPLATTRTPLTSSTSGRTLSSPNPRSSRLSNHCQAQPLVWL
jgi:hypothetical protein